MSELTYAQAVVLGVVQGLTEFLPVSSSAHLALTQRLFDLEPNSDAMLIFDLATHLATLLAVVVVFAGTFVLFARRLLRETSADGPVRKTAWKIVFLGVVATIPTVIIGVGFKDQLEAAFDKPRWIGVCLLITGVLMWVGGKMVQPRRGWRRFGFGRAVVVGLAQGAAILPGISRSGSTICTAMILGLKRRWAAEFSFFIAMPAICGAAVFKAKDIPSGELGSLLGGPTIAGSVAAFAVGVVALKLLLGAVRRAKLHYFSVYCWLLGAVVLAFLR